MSESFCYLGAATKGGSSNSGGGSSMRIRFPPRRGILVRKGNILEKIFRINVSGTQQERNENSNYSKEAVFGAPNSCVP